MTQVKHEFKVQEDGFGYDMRWRWTCACGKRGRWQWQSPNASYYLWCRHAKVKP